jgi:hypothetical protein
MMDFDHYTLGAMFGAVNAARISLIKLKIIHIGLSYFFINVWRKSVFDIYFTEFGTALTTILPILFQYCYKYCYSDSRNLWAVMKARGLAL